MEKTLEYKIDHKQKIIFETCKGRIILNELIELEKAKFSDPEHNSSYSIIVDIREAIFDISNTEKELFYKMLKDVTTKIDMDRKCAFITHKPKEVVFAELFQIRMRKFSPVNFKTFSTEKAAHNWIKEV